MVQGVTPFKIFRIRFDMPKGMKDALSGDQIDAKAQSAMNAALDAAAAPILERLREALGKGGRFGVGATGTAATNFIKRKHKDRVEIWEGNKTVANYFIRRGSSPGKPPPVGEIMAWATAKRLPLKYNDERTRYISPKQKRRIRPLKKYENTFTRACIAIAKSIGDSGTSDYSEMFRPPVGRRHFDYPKYVMEPRTVYERVLNRIATSFTGMFIEFCMAGSRERGEDRFLREQFRYRTIR